MASALPHIAIFPFFSKGHTIPLIHLASLLHARRLATLTFFTTPLNAPFLRDSLIAAKPDIIELPFPENTPAESTDHLQFVEATKLLQPSFERALSDLPTLTFLISDIFLGWTAESAAKFAVPRVVFSGMGLFPVTINYIISQTLPHAGISSSDELFGVPGFPHLRLTKADLFPPFDEPDHDTPLKNFVLESRKATRASHGIMANTFYDLEAIYVDCWNRDFAPKSWCVGPFCLARPEVVAAARGDLMEWLDSRSATNRPVVYVAFGTQTEVSAAQMQEIEVGLEQSGLDFLWVVRSKGSELAQGFEERMADRGRVVRHWVDQLGILRHKSVKGFVSHCGWNSVMESVSAGVPILAWPMIAEQPLNAKLVADELGIGLRIRARDGTRNGLVMHDDIRDMTRELLLGEKGRVAAQKAKYFAGLAKKAMMDGGSSASTLELMIEELSRKRTALRNTQQ